MKEEPRSDCQDRKGALKANGGYRPTLQGIEEGVWTIDANGAADSINPQGAKILRYAAEEVPGRFPLTSVVATFSDITDRRTAAEEARQPRRSCTIFITTHHLGTIRSTRRVS